MHENVFPRKRFVRPVVEGAARARAWPGALARGALVGLAGSAAFFALHAVIVEPLWGRPDALARGALLGPAAGALLGLVFARVRAREPRFANPLAGVILGALMAAALVPFAIAGWLRARGAPDPFWIAMLALLLVSIHQLVHAAHANGTRTQRLELLGAILLANAFPAFFLTFIADFHEETPDPRAMTFAVCVIYIGAGALLEALHRRRRSTTNGRTDAETQS